MVNIKLSGKPQASKNVRGVFRSKDRVLMSPIEELTTPVQMAKLEPWIKEIYGQAKLTTGTFSSPLKETSQYNNKEEHQPISDWSARVNQEYYDNMIDTTLDWGQLERWGEGDIRPIRYPPKKPLSPKGPPKGPATYEEREVERRKVYQEALRKKHPLGPPVRSFFEDFWDTMDYIRQFKNDYRSLTETKVKQRVEVIKAKLVQLWAKSGDVPAYYRQVLVEMIVKVNAVLRNNIVNIRKVSIRLFLFAVIIFLFCQAYMLLSNFNWLNWGNDPGLTSVPINAEGNRIARAMENLRPYDRGDYLFDLPPDVGPEGFLYQPPPIENLNVPPVTETGFLWDFNMWDGTTDLAEWTSSLDLVSHSGNQIQMIEYEPQIPWYSWPKPLTMDSVPENPILTIDPPPTGEQFSYLKAFWTGTSTLMAGFFGYLWTKKHSKNPTSIEEMTDEDWYDLKNNKISQGTFQGDQVSFCDFLIKATKQIGDIMIVSFPNPYVGLQTKYSKGILIDGLGFDAVAYKGIKDKLVNLAEFQKVKFIGKLKNNVILCDNLQLTYRPVDLKDAGKERSKNITYRTYWLVDEFKFFTTEGNISLLAPVEISQEERKFLNLLRELFGLEMTDAEFLGMSAEERSQLFDATDFS